MSLEYFCGSLNFGGGLLGIMKMARIGCISKYGGLDSAISITVIPNAHISTY